MVIKGVACQRPQYWNKSSLKYNRKELKKRVYICGLEFLESDLRPVANCCIGVHGNESLGFLKSVEFLDQIADIMLSARTDLVG